MRAHAGVLVHTFRHRGKGVKCPLLGSGDVEVVEKTEKSFAWLQGRVRFDKCVVLRSGEKRRHQRVSLFAAFCLYHRVRHAVCVSPEKARL